MKKYLSAADYAVWELKNYRYTDELNTFSTYDIKNTFAFPEEIRLQQQTLSLQDFIDNADKYTLYE